MSENGGTELGEGVWTEENRIGEALKTTDEYFKERRIVLQKDAIGEGSSDDGGEDGRLERKREAVEYSRNILRLDHQDRGLKRAKIAFSGIKTGFK